MSEWPVDLRGITESVVTTKRADGSWNVAALGLQATEASTEGNEKRAPNDHVTARTWGESRTKRGFERDGGGYVQFTRDPVVVVEAALDDWTVDDPLLPATDAWANVTATRIATGTEGDTVWTDWALEPTEAGVEHRTVPTINRGFAAVVEATVAASRVGVAAYDDDRLRERIDYFESVVERCGGPREQEAFDRLHQLRAKQ